MEVNFYSPVKSVSEKSIIQMSEKLCGYRHSTAERLKTDSSKYRSNVKMRISHLTYR